MSSIVITARFVLDDQRTPCTAKLFGNNFPMRLEPTVFDMAGRLAAEYNGGYWFFYALSNGGFYMAPRSDTLFAVSCENGFEGHLIAARTAKSKVMRTLPLNDAALEVLSQLDTKNEFEYLFVNRRTKTRYFTVAKAWSKICTDAKIKARLHSLRHFFGSTLACSGVDIHTISKLLGHASVTTSQRYSALNQEALLRGSQKASIAMKGVSMESTTASAPATH